MSYLTSVDNGITTITGDSIIWGSSGSGLVSSGSSYVTISSGEYGTVSGTVFGIKSGVINPALYFRFMKSKLTKLQQSHLKKRISKLKTLLDNAEEINQKGYAEQLTQMLAIVIREQEAFVCGVDSSIAKSFVTEFMNKVKDRVVKFGSLEEFPRPIPKKQATRIKSVQDKKLFDDYWILYTDYVDEKPMKTTEKKVIEKDPICFGSYKYQPDKLYFICDWIDEYCDLTLDKIVDKIEITETPEINERYIAKIKKEVSRRHQVLKDTNAGNFKQLAIMESVRNKKGFVGWLSRKLLGL